MKRLAALLLVCAACTCGRGQAHPDAEPTTPAEPETPPVRTAVVEGVVRLREGAENPSYPPREGEQPAPPEECTPPQISDRQPLTVGGDRGVAGVLVTASAESMSRVPHEAVTHRVEIQDCRLGPKLVVATVGDKLVISNPTPIPFVPRLATDSFGQALLSGQTREITLDNGGVFALGCMFGTECGRTDIVVLHYPVHTVSEANGHFRITNVPVGEPLALAAWHPLLAESTQPITVPEGGLHDLVIEIAPPAAAATPAPDEPGPAEEQPGLF